MAISRGAVKSFFLLVMICLSLSVLNCLLIPCVRNLKHGRTCMSLARLCLSFYTHPLWCILVGNSDLPEQSLYSVFHVIVLQEQGCCELVLGLIVSPKASMWPQDWAEFSFRSEILLNWLNNVAGRWSENRKKIRSGDFSSIYRVLKMDLSFIHPFLSPYDFNSDWFLKVVIKKDFMRI